MDSFFTLTTPAKRLRFVAVLEAFSWAGLLIGMYFKYFTGDIDSANGVYPHEIGVKIFGMVHGVIFVAFVILAILAARALKWSAVTTVLAILSSLPPFFTVIFEIWAQRTGRLGELSTGDEPVGAVA